VWTGDLNLSYLTAITRAGITSRDGWSTFIFANNVTNKHASLDNMIQLTLPSPEYNRVQTNQPLTIGIGLSYRFR